MFQVQEPTYRKGAVTAVVRILGVLLYPSNLVEPSAPKGFTDKLKLGATVAVPLANTGDAKFDKIVAAYAKEGFSVSKFWEDYAKFCVASHSQPGKPWIIKNKLATTADFDGPFSVPSESLGLPGPVEGPDGFKKSVAWRTFKASTQPDRADTKTADGKPIVTCIRKDGDKTVRLTDIAEIRSLFVPGSLVLVTAAICSKDVHPTAYALVNSVQYIGPPSKTTVLNIGGGGATAVSGLGSEFEDEEEILDSGFEG